MIFMKAHNNFIDFYLCSDFKEMEARITTPRFTLHADNISICLVQITNAQMKHNEYNDLYVYDECMPVEAGSSNNGSNNKGQQ